MTHVALDIDGVLFPWDEAARQALEARGAVTVERDEEREGRAQHVKEWQQLRESVHPDDWQWLFTLEGGRQVITRHDLFYPGVPEGLKRLAEICDLSFITHRPPIIAAETACWLAAHDFPFRSLHILGGAGAKSSVQPQADIYVEDRPDNVMEILDGTRSSHVLMPKMSHNVDLHVNDHPRLIVYNNFEDVVAFVEGYVEGRAPYES